VFVRCDRYALFEVLRGCAVQGLPLGGRETGSVPLVSPWDCSSGCRLGASREAGR